MEEDSREGPRWVPAGGVRRPRGHCSPELASERSEASGWLTKEADDLRLKALLPLEFTFPNDKGHPAKGFEGSASGSVSSFVPVDLIRPVFSIMLRHTSAASAVMPVPETPVHEDHFVRSRKHQIRLARKIPSVQPVAKTIRENNPANRHLRRCVFAFHRLHGPPSYLWPFHDIHDLRIAVNSDSRTISPARRILVRRTVSAPLCSTSKST